MWAHPHISLDDAQKLLAEAEQELAVLSGRHDGPPESTHEDAKQWQVLRVRVAECYFLLGDTPRALGICNEVIERYPDFPDTYSMRRAVYLSQGEGERADADARRYLQLGAGTPTLALQLIMRSVADDNPEQALASRRLQLQLAEAAIQQWPEDPSLWAERLRLLVQIEDPSAPAVFAEVFASGSEEQRYQAAVTFEKYAGRDEFIGWFTKQDHPWLKQVPEDLAASRVNLAALLYRSGLQDLSSQAAKTAFEGLDKEAQRVQDGEIFAEYVLSGIEADRARCLAMMGQWTAALEMVEKRSEEDSDVVLWKAARVACLRQLGREEEAIQAEEDYRSFFEVVGLDPGALPAWP